MDVYRCGDCQKEFDSYENFLIHKLLFEQYKLTVEPSERIPGLRIPKFLKTQKHAHVQKHVITPISNNSEDHSLTATPSGVNTTINSSDSEQMPPPAKDSTNSQEPECCNDSEAVLVIKTECSSQDIDLENDDNVSIWSQSESLRIDESVAAKDSLSSLLPEGHLQQQPKKDCQVYCKNCDKYYKNKVALRVHEETVHSSERPHICATCKQAFKTKGSLVRHVRTHTGERPFRCRECGRAFHDSGTLSRHIHRLHCILHGKQQPSDIQVFITRLDEECEPPSADFTKS